jgi:hypothetical protein
MRSVDQKRRELFRFLAEHSALLALQGSIQASYRVYRGRQLGPFFRLSFREAGKQRSRYIGGDRALAAEIGRHLQKLQAPLSGARQIERSLTEHRHQLKLAKAEFRRHLEVHGLRLQGNEIRGWRNVAFAPLTCPVRQGAAIEQEPAATARLPVRTRIWNHVSD